jgi:hypothetical protein
MVIHLPHGVRLGREVELACWESHLGRNPCWRYSKRGKNKNPGNYFGAVIGTPFWPGENMIPIPSQNSGLTSSGVGHAKTTEIHMDDKSVYQDLAVTRLIRSLLRSIWCLITTGWICRGELNHESQACVVCSCPS